MRKPDLIGFAIAMVGCILISGCENNLQDVEDLSYNKNKVTVDKSYGVEMIYSDSAIVKSKLIAPEVYHYTFPSNAKEPYYETKKGVTIIFYEIDQKEKGRVTSDYAIWKEAQRIVDLQKNVVVINTEGKTLKSDQIIWDQNKHLFYSDKMAILTIPNKTGTPTILYGDGFTSDEDLKYPKLIHARGNISVLQQEGF